MKLASFIHSLRVGARDGAKKSAHTILYKHDKTIINLLKAHSPKDSGYFADHWRVKRIRFGSRNTLAGLLIVNDTPKYGKFVAFGATPRKAPWYYPHGRQKSGRTTSPSGKLTESGGKIWAGGLNPGHDKTVGGPANKIIEDYSNKISQGLANEIIKDIFQK